METQLRKTKAEGTNEGVGRKRFFYIFWMPCNQSRTLGTITDRRIYFIRNVIILYDNIEPRTAGITLAKLEKKVMWAT